MADGAISPEQAQYEANVKGWAGIDRVKADDHIIKQIESDKQNTVKSDPFESARALGVAAASEADKQKKAEMSIKERILEVRKNISEFVTGNGPRKPQNEPQAV